MRNDENRDLQLVENIFRYCNFQPIGNAFQESARTALNLIQAQEQNPVAVGPVQLSLWTFLQEQIYNTAQKHAQVTIHTLKGDGNCLFRALALAFTGTQQQRDIIKYKLLSLTYKVLTTNQPQYLHNLISVQPCRNTRSSSTVTFARPPTRSSLKITNRSFQYAAHCLWNELPIDLREPRQTQSPSLSLITHGSSSSSSSPSSRSPLASSLTRSVFHFELKTWLFGKSFPP